MAAGVAFFTKQTGGAFVLFVLARSLLFSRANRTLCFCLALAGALAPIVLYFLAHPRLLGPFFEVAVEDVWTFSKADGIYSIPISAAFRRRALAATWWCPALLLILLSELGAAWYRGDGDRKRLATGTLMMATGFLLYGPFLVRTFHRYLQLCVPFLAVGVVLVFAILAGGQLGQRIRLALYSVVLVSILATQFPGLQKLHLARLDDPTPRAVEEMTAAWIERVTAGHDEILILPYNSQYYALAGKRSPTGEYLPWPSSSQVAVAAQRRVPVVLFRESPWPRVEPYPRLLLHHGYRVATGVSDRLTLWLPEAGSPLKPLTGSGESTSTPPRR